MASKKMKWREGKHMVATAELRLDARMQSRVKVCQEAIEEYSERYSAGGVDALPCVDVVVVGQGDDAVAYVVDGWHRVMAATKAGLASIQASVEFGDLLAAKLRAASANQVCGVRRTNKDKRRAVLIALDALKGADEGTSAKRIADLCGVTRQFVYMVAEQDEAMARAKEAASLPVYEAEQPAEATDATTGIEEVGYAIEDRMKAAKRTLGALAASLKVIAQEVEQVCDNGDGAAIYLNRQAVIADIKNAISAIRRSMPHSICPVCVGGACATCHNVGWMSVQQYKLLPVTQRGEGSAT